MPRPNELVRKVTLTGYALKTQQYVKPLLLLP